MRTDRLTRGNVAALFLCAGVLALPFADFSLAGHDPWATLLRMVQGFAAPNFGAVEDIGRSVALTLMFAVCGVALGCIAGFALAPFYHVPLVRGVCIAIRSIHELFWALLLIQVIGIGAPAGVIAIGLPYMGIFAKVFAEQIEEADRRPCTALSGNVDPLSRFLYARLPLVWSSMRTYTLYRLECGLRSSAVLGFIGLPTLGFQLDSFFRQGDYGAASAIMICYVALIASIRFWMRPILAPLWLIVSATYLAMLPSPPMGQGALWRFLTIDIVPAPLRHVLDLPALTEWLASLTWNEVVPGAISTILVAQIALVLTAILAMSCFWLTVDRVAGRVGAIFGHLVLVVIRSLPEYMLAYLFLQIFGPSMLPAILALSIHNGGIIAHLLGRDAQELVAKLRVDAPKGLTLWGYELVPRLFGTFVALCLYRWEIIVRETAVMGLLGVMTLGFFVDSAVSELRLDRAIVLLFAGGCLTVAIDWISVNLRSRLGARVANTKPGKSRNTSQMANTHNTLAYSPNPSATCNINAYEEAEHARQ